MLNNKKIIRAFAPATVANVSCGFDVLGFAVDQPGDEVEIALNASAEVVIKSIVGDKGRLPLQADKNTAGVAVMSLLNALGLKQGVEITLYKNLPLGSGMGSSAASAVAALIGINYLLGEPFQKKDLLPFAMEAERVACGAAHADNVAPSLLGGVVLVRGYDPLDVVDIPLSGQLYCTLAHPNIELKTEDSRQVLRQNIPLKDAITQWGNIAGLVAGLMKPDYDLIGRSLKDVVAEPIRSLLIPGFNEIKDAAVKEGALGCGISGSGPTLFALSKNYSTADRVGRAMQLQFLKHKLNSEFYVSEVNRKGAYVIAEAVTA
ncbi:homoserine kinase [Chryseosolibacter indicus]|uniref:Homoserine kinase n=1 Tax=Chryseosolibacter indicus TaxID=2782351 RepID=A0ABS5VLR0_9BACT|nr:homoserine kinase [Chryseosolibacter indicus]MBT1702403.1 homoserine kinase [Chryseosolibacter indicus]